MPGKLIWLVGPSGSGKDSLAGGAAPARAPAAAGGPSLHNPPV